VTYFKADVVSDWQAKTLQFNWNRDIYYMRHYCVDEGLIAERAGNARAALQDLVDAWRKRNTAEYPALLRAVAKEGYDLYKGLFLGSNNNDRAGAKWVQEYLAEKSCPFTDTITFDVPPAVHFPWSSRFSSERTKSFGTQRTPCFVPNNRATSATF
jgi:hypothetical protein